jgi:diguanylate cyclase (GGDEF)-like protein
MTRRISIIPIGGAEHPNATHGKKLNGKRYSFGAAKKIAPGSAGVPPARAQQAPHDEEPAPALIRYRQQSKPAANQKHEIELLTERNASLQQELIELAQKEAQARQLAYHDGLTGLPNRSLLQDRFHQAISQAQRHRKPLALLLLDLDEFKRVNDKLGHASGDKLLKALAQRLSAGIRGADTACRYGGDEFVVMLSEIDNSDTAVTLAVELGTRLGQPYIIDGYQIHMTVSVGTAVYPTDGKTYDALIKQADLAMYRAKGTGSNISIFAAPKERLGEAEIQNQDVSKDADRGNEYGSTPRDDSALAS